MLRPLITATVAVTLLAGCSGGDDKSADQAAADGTPSASSSPTPPEPATFDPPKAFAAVSALARSETTASNSRSDLKAGMVGRTALYAQPSGLTGYDLTGHSWEAPSSIDPATTTASVTSPMAVQVDGKEVIAMAYAQNVAGTGTQKSHAQVKLQWIDPADGKVLVETVADLAALLGPDGTVGFVSPAYDAATGQLAVTTGVRTANGPADLDGVTVFADPATKKVTTIPGLEAAGVLNGVIIGAQGDDEEDSGKSAIVQVDGATGKVKKSTPLPAVTVLDAVGTGGKHGYFVSDTYQSNISKHVSSIYAADIATGAVVETKYPVTEYEAEPTTCFSDHVGSVVCQRVHQVQGPVVVTGFDDNTGKKAWELDTTSVSRVVPRVTAMYNGVVYGSARNKAVVLDAKTGQDVPVPSATPSDASTPTEGETPSDGETPADGESPTDATSEPPSSLPGRGEWGDTSLLYGDPRSPEMVSKYGSAYLQDPGDKAPMRTERILVVQKAIG
jgi:hypothetical protein